MEEIFDEDWVTNRRHDIIPGKNSLLERGYLGIEVAHSCDSRTQKSEAGRSPSF